MSFNKDNVVYGCTVLLSYKDIELFLSLLYKPDLVSTKLETNFNMFFLETYLFTILSVSSGVCIIYIFFFWNILESLARNIKRKKARPLSFV